MLGQLRQNTWGNGTEYFRPDVGDTDELTRIRAEVERLATFRYFILFMGAGLLLWLAAKVLWLDGSMTFIGMLRVALAAVLGPALAWLASDKEVRLLRQLDKHSQQLEQRLRETKALNRMMQAHLVDCVPTFPEEPSIPDERLVSAQETRIPVAANSSHLSYHIPEPAGFQPGNGIVEPRYLESARNGSRGV
jgi:hypothetical protein